MKLLARPKNKMDYIYITLAIVMSAFVLYQESRYEVKNDEQAIIIQFNGVITPPITEARTHFKIPFIQEAHFYPKNEHIFKHEHEIQTLNKTLIRLNIQAVWKLDDPIAFYNRLYYFDDNAIDFIEAKIQEAEKRIITATKLSDIVFKSDDTATKNLECSPEVLRRIKKEAQLDLREFGILLLNIKATVHFPI